MPSDHNLTQLVKTLQRVTESGPLCWETTPDPYEFKAFLPSGDSVRLLREYIPPLIRDEGGSLLKPALMLIVLDKNGQLIEEWRPTDEGEWSAVDELHQMARRSALKAKDKLKGILETLNASYPEKQRTS